jgi:hypothetical protein
MIIRVIIMFSIINLITNMKLVKIIGSNNPNPISKVQNINQYFYQKYNNLENMTRLSNNKISSQM